MDTVSPHFREVARQMTAEEKEKSQLCVSINMNESLKQGSAGTKNLGYAIPLKIFYRLGLDRFLRGKAQSRGFEFNTVSIMVLLVMARLLMPGSKKSAYDSRDKFFERFDFTLDDVYRSLGHFDAISGEMQRCMYESVRAEYGSDTSVVYYDVTNYCFEIKKEDDFRKYGMSKEKRKRPIVLMGLAMDKSGVPLRYELFRGNMTDKETFRKVIGDARKDYGTGRIVVVADMGIITGDNINYLVGQNPDKPRNGYVFSFSVAGGSDLFQKYVLNENGYVCAQGKPPEPGADFKIKWRVTPREIWVTMQNGNKRKRTVHEKQVVFWSKKHADKARSEREAIIEKAMKLIANPFKLTKSDLEARPVYVRSKEQINAHFLTCFIALTLLRIMQKQTGKRFSSAKIIDSLNNVVCLSEFENVFLFGFRNEVSDSLCEAFDIDLTKKRLPLSSVKNILASAKTR